MQSQWLNVAINQKSIIRDVQFNMSENMINKIDNAVRELNLNLSPTNERIFSLGIQLGKHIAISGDNFDRLPFFVESESKRNGVIRKEALNDKIAKLIGNLFYLACAEQIKNRGAVAFSIDPKPYNSLHSLDPLIGEKFFIKECHATEKDGSDSCRLHFEVIGAVADLFEKYGFCKGLAISCENPYGGTSVEISSLQDLPRYIQTDQVEFNRIRISYGDNKISATDEEENLQALFDELSRELLFFHIAHQA